MECWYDSARVDSHVTKCCICCLCSERPELPMAQPTAPADTAAPTTLVDLLSLSSVSQEDLSSHATHSYISHLTSLPLDTLLTEPGRLATESDILTADLTQLCHSQHKTFLSLRSASNALSSSLGSLTSSLDVMLNEWIPSLDAEARMFTENTHHIQHSRAKASLVLEHHEKLLDVLELPHLLATCVKNGYYSEALDLANHFERNLMSTLPPSTLLESVHTSVVTSLQSLLQQLLQQLRAPAKLPALFKTVNLLRRMEVCSEEQLALAFILGRSAFLDDAFSNANTSNGRGREEDPARWLRKWVEVFREGVYDVVTQYSSIFMPNSSTLNPSQPASSPSSTASSMAPLRTILTNFTHTYLSQLLELVRSTLPKIPLADMSSLSSLVTQLSYCASSFARVGLDFRQALVPIVEDTILEIVGNAFVESADALIQEVTNADRARRHTSEWLIEAESITSLPRRAAATTTHVHVPPQRLTHTPPLAVFTNGILTALNALRLMPIPSIYDRIRQQLMKSLVRTSDALLQYAKAHTGPIVAGEDRDEEMRLLAALTSFIWNDAEGALPYLGNALNHGVYASYPRASTLSESSWTNARERWISWANEVTLKVDIGESAGVDEINGDLSSASANVGDGIIDSVRSPDSGTVKVNGTERTESFDL